MLLARVVACGLMTSLITSASGIIYPQQVSPLEPPCLLPPLTSSPICNARSLAHKMPAVTSPDNTVKICFWYSFFHFNFAACIKLCASVSGCVCVWVRECVLVCVVSLLALLLKFSWVQSQQGGNYQAERSNGQLGATCRLINQLLGLYTASPFLTFFFSV